ncbi:MAG: sigma-70 family RNA polymerase sigma factor [Clostridiales Family XIII bacterium]|nr:sigma-70 family RNA polymerase sigma factor [Clostridiales Family XIII bacterium]
MAKDGDVRAFESLCGMFAKSILFEARRYIGNPHDADDAAQEAVIAMHRSIGGLRDPDAFRPWMYRLVKYCCLKHVRRLNVLKGGEDAADIDDYSESLPDERSEGNPQESLLADERVALIRKAIGQLCERQRESLILYYYENLTYSEIAYALGCTASTVSTNIMKAKRNIARMLAPYEAAETVEG